MFKRMILTGLFFAILVLPAFSYGTGFDATQGNPFSQTEIPNTCDYEHLGESVYTRDVTLEAIWVKVSEIQLDSDIHMYNEFTGMPLQPVVPTVVGTPSVLYGIYEKGIYSDSNLTQPLTRLTTVPEKAGYVFDGFWTENKNHDAEVQVIDEHGNILDVAKNNIPFDNDVAGVDEISHVTWYAHWHRAENSGEQPEPDVIVCSVGQYWSKESKQCEICPENYYCPQETVVNLTLAQDQGKTACSSVSDGGPYSPKGSTRSGDCGYVLHVGEGDENRLYLHTQEGRTHPALAVEVDGKIWYADMTPVSEGDKNITSDSGAKELHIQVDDKEYTVHGRYVK